ncbi:MAG: metallophosphoesterase family protein [Gammaproteobacteria bacterium]
MFWKKKSEDSGAGKLSIFFASDLHGSTVCFKKFVNGAKFYGANILFLGGDLTGKAVLPIAKQGNGSYLAAESGETITLATKSEVEEYSHRTTNKGFYPIVVSEDEYQELKKDADKQQTLFKKLVVDRVAEWCEYAGEKLKGSGIPLITAPGNDDFYEMDDVLSNAPAVQYHDMEVTELNGYEVLHCGGSTVTPWDTEREYSEEEYQAKFDELAAKVSNMDRCIYNVHVPPYGTVLDSCPKLDDELKVVFEMGNPVSMHAGSKSLMASIEKHQPLLGIHGHIHEGRGKISIGRTICVNPGSVYPEGILQGALITIKGDKVKAVNLTQG